MSAPGTTPPPPSTTTPEIADVVPPWPNAGAADDTSAEIATSANKPLMPTLQETLARTQKSYTMANAASPSSNRYSGAQGPSQKGVKPALTRPTCSSSD